MIDPGIFNKGKGSRFPQGQLKKEINVKSWQTILVEVFKGIYLRILYKLVK